MQRRQLLRGIAALAAGQTLAGPTPVAAAGQKPLPAGVHEIVGEVRINGRQARPGQLLQAGDRIETGPAAQAIYVVERDAYLQRAGSSVQLIEDNAARRVLRIVHGKLLAVFGKGEKSLQTPVATIGIRGTGCYIEAEAARVYFCLCYGRAEIVAAERPEQRETIETLHHDRPLYLYADASRMIAPATVENHSDAELIRLEGLVGRIPPFVTAGRFGY